MAKPTRTRNCPTCGEEFVSDEQWDDIDECPDCVAEDPNEGLAEEFDYGVGGPRFGNQEPSQGVHGNG